MPVGANQPNFAIMQRRPNVGIQQPLEPSYEIIRGDGLLRKKRKSGLSPEPTEHLADDRDDALTGLWSRSAERGSI